MVFLNSWWYRLSSGVNQNVTDGYLRNKFCSFYLNFCSIVTLQFSGIATKLFVFSRILTFVWKDWCSGFAQAMTITIQILVSSIIDFVKIDLFFLYFDFLDFIIGRIQVIGFFVLLVEECQVYQWADAVFELMLLCA